MILLATALWAVVYFAFRDDPSPTGIAVGTTASFLAVLCTVGALYLLIT